MGLANKPITKTASFTLDRKIHQDTIVNLSASGGMTVTLPQSLGTGDVYRLFVRTNLTTSNYVVQVANATDVIQGAVMVSTDIAGVTCPATATSDTITMSGSTTGGVLGSYIELRDVATGFWMVTGSLVSTGAEATPFSAAVS